MSSLIEPVSHGGADGTDERDLRSVSTDGRE